MILEIFVNRFVCRFIYRLYGFTRVLVGWTESSEVPAIVFLRLR